MAIVKRRVEMLIASYWLGCSVIFFLDEGMLIKLSFLHINPPVNAT